MANYVAANLAKAQAVMTQQFNSGELRFRQPAVLMEYKRNSDIAVPSYKVIRTREDRAVEISFLARSWVALGAARSHDHTGLRGDSSVLAPAWTTYSRNFKHSLKQADNSVFSMEQEVANEYANAIYDFAEGLELAATNHAFNNRSGVNAYTSQGTFNAVQDTFEIPEATETRAVQITKSAMDFNKYQGMGYTFFCDTVAFDKFEYQAFQGSGNNANLSFQFSGINFVKAIDLDALAAGLAAPYTKGFWIAVPQGMIAALDWIPIQNRMGVITKENEYSSVLNPVDGWLYGQHSYQVRADETATNGYTQDLVTQVQLAVDVAFEHAPIVAADTTPLLAYAIV